MSFSWVFDAERNLVGDTDAIAFEGDDFFRVIGKNTNIFQAEVDQDLCADTAFVLYEALARRRAIELSAGVNVNLRKNARLTGGLNAKAAACVVQIKKNTAILFGNCGERTGNQFVAITGDRAEYIPGEAVGMNAHKSWIGTVEFAANERHMLIVIHVAGVCDHAEIAEAGRQNGFCYSANVALMLHAVADEFGDREHF